MPRERLLAHGRRALSDQELLTLLLGSGNRCKSGSQLAAEILNSCGNNLDELAKLSVEALCAIPGLGQAKAMGLAAAFELGLRRQVPSASKPSVRSSADAYRIMRPHLVDLQAEAFLVLYMNRRHAVIRLETLSTGGISSTVVDVRLLLKRALELGATSLIVGHNHPSGNLNPSPQDRSLTEQLMKASRFLEVELLDHLIVTEAGYTSFSDEGLLGA
jgi:DNA repair protein RadC